jgi:uncharacterized protein YdeI (YjbR/CyaY-like superfamily)
MSSAQKWRDEFAALRAIILDCGLTESLKWRVPCYTHQERNVVLIHGFKAYCALLFFKGALLSDPKGVLIRQSENVQAGRQIRFTDVHDIVALATVVKTYVREAIDVETAGLQVDFKPTAEFAVTAEFQAMLDEAPALKDSFNALTPGRQRAYLLHFSAPKQSVTRRSRIEKNIQRILIGKGLND